VPYLNQRIELVYFKAGIFLLLVVQQVGHDCFVVLDVLAEWDRDGLTAAVVWWHVTRLHVSTSSWHLTPVSERGAHCIGRRR